MNALKQFYDNETQREAFKAFMIECLNELAIERVMKRQDISGIADAKVLVDKTFIKLKEIYGEKPKPIIKSSR